jgi:hypothetical protein
MKSWMLDIKNEAQNITITDEDQMDWWNALFGEIQTIEPKTNATRRDGLHGENDHDEPPPPPSPAGTVPPPVGRREERTPSDYMTIAPMFVQVPSGDFKGYTERGEGFSDDDSDDENNTTPKQSVGGKPGESFSANSTNSNEHKRKSHASAIVSAPNTASKYSKKIKSVFIFLFISLSHSYFFSLFVNCFSSLIVFLR